MLPIPADRDPRPGRGSAREKAETPTEPSDLRLFAPTGDELEPTIIVGSAAMLAVLAQARRIASSKVTVLIEGESGTGKELVARLIHAASPRAPRPFIRVNCAALSESLIESELFGHERGAFTGAEQLHAGRFERADGGTLLLDEIGELPLKLQAKLLRVLEQEELERVGGVKTLTVDVRVLATTNRSLEHESALGSFRRDLYYRLSAVPLQLPPLRERPEDIPILTQAYIARFGLESLAGVKSASPRALESLQAYSWPGNVRQLRNVIQHACILAQQPILQPEDLPPLREPGSTPRLNPHQTLAEIERQVILETLREVGGNRTAASQRLGVTTRTLLNKLKRYRECP